MRGHPFLSLKNSLTLLLWYLDDEDGRNREQAVSMDVEAEAEAEARGGMWHAAPAASVVACISLHGEETRELAEVSHEEW